MADATSTQDGLRSQRQFVSLLSGFFGFEDQSMANADGQTASPPGGYQVIDPSTGAVGAQGAPVSTAQGAGGMSPAVLVGLVAVIGLAAWFIVKKG